MKLIKIVAVFCIFFSAACGFFSGGSPADVYFSEDLDSLSRPRLPVPNREIIRLTVVDDSTMKTGFVRVQMVIDEQGRVSRAGVVTSLGRREDSIALVRSKTLPDFIPGTIKGRPVKVIYFLPFVFNPYAHHPASKR